MQSSLTTAADHAALPFLDACRQAARNAHVRFLPGREGIAAEVDHVPNHKCKHILDGHAPSLPVLAALHLRACCQFRLPVEHLADGGRIVQDGRDLEVLGPTDRPGQGELIAAALLDDEGLIESLLMPAGPLPFADEHLETARGWGDLRPRFIASDLQFEFAHTAGGLEIRCRFTVEMNAYPRCEFEARSPELEDPSKDT